MRQLAGIAQVAVILLLPPLVLLSGTAGALRYDRPTTNTEVWLVVAASLAPLIAGVLLRLALPSVDLILVTACGMLTSISAVSMMKIAQLPGETQGFFQSVLTRHLAFVVASFVAIILGAYFSRYVQLILRYPYLTAAAALGLIGSTMLLGTAINGAKLWIVVGPVRVQPAEIARVLLTLFVAAYLYDRRHLIATNWRLGPLQLPPVPYLVPVAGALLIALTALAVQNDLGMAALSALAAFAMIAGSLRSRWSVLAIGVVVASVIWSTSVVSPRVQARVDSWLDPWHAPMGSGYQFIQGEYGLALGGVSGAALSPDVRSVPEVQTDFVIAAIGAQSGLLVSVAVLALLAVVVLRCARNAGMAATELEGHMATALTVLLGLQILLILGGVLRLLPLTGVTLPFVSYGGTSMLVTGFTVGVILGIGGRRASIASW